MTVISGRGQQEKVQSTGESSGVHDGIRWHPNSPDDNVLSWQQTQTLPTPQLTGKPPRVVGLLWNGCYLILVVLVLGQYWTLQSHTGPHMTDCFTSSDSRHQTGSALLCCKRDFPLIWSNLYGHTYYRYNCTELLLYLNWLVCIYNLALLCGKCGFPLIWVTCMDTHT